MEILASSTNDFTELAKAVGIIITATAAAILLFMKAYISWQASRNGTSTDQDGCKDCRNQVSATYRVLKEIKSLLDKEDPMADRLRVYTPRNMEDDLKSLKESSRVIQEAMKRVEGMVDDIHDKSNVWDGNPGA